MIYIFLVTDKREIYESIYFNIILNSDGIYENIMKFAMYEIIAMHIRSFCSFFL